MPSYRIVSKECFSTVGQPGERIFCISVPEMVQCGVSEKYIWNGLKLQRYLKLSCWPHHKEGNNVYLHYAGLKPQYQAMIRNIILDGKTPERWYEDEGRLQNIESMISPYISLTADEELFFDSATYSDGEKMNKVSREKAREACRIMSAISKLDKKQNIKSAGWNSVNDFYTDVIYMIKRQAITLPAVYSRLRAKVRSYEHNGPSEAIDNRGRSNKNAAKVMTKEQTALLATICGRGASYDAEQIAYVYNTVAKANGWDTIGRRSALNYMKEYELYIRAGRDGSEAFRNKISMQIRRQRPTEALSLWELDGWTAELYYKKDVKDSKGHIVHTYQNRLVVEVVMDACCNYIVGFAIGESESVSLIREALKNSIDHVNAVLGNLYRPYQIQSDHYGIKGMKSIYEDLANYFTPARVKNSKAKTIERAFKAINRICQEKYGNLNWSGFGITSKKSQQPNIDILNSNKTHFPDKEGVIEQIRQVIAEDRINKRDTWIRCWQSMPESDRLLMTRESYLLDFGQRNERTIRLTAGCLEPTILGEKRSYDSFDIEFRKKTLQSWTICYDENDLNTILAVDDTGKKRFILQATHKQPMALRDRKPGDFDALHKVDEFNKNMLEEHVRDTYSEMNQIAFDVIERSRAALEGKKAYTMLTDSRGQHKALLQHSATIKSEEDLIAEAEEKIRLNAHKTAIKEGQKADKKAKKNLEAEYEKYQQSNVDRMMAHLDDY